MNERPVFDADLMRRYRGAGAPPGNALTLPSLTERVGESAFCEFARRSNRELVPPALSLSLRTTSPAQMSLDRPDRPFLERLLREIEAVGRLFDRDREVVAIRLSPSSGIGRHHPDLEEILAAIDRNFHLRDRVDRDFALELDPATATSGDVERLARIGFNRTSVVLASARQDRLLDDAGTLIDLCHASGFRSVKLRMPCGPCIGQGKDPETSLERILATRPDCVELWPLAGTSGTFAPERPSVSSNVREANDWLRGSQAAIELLVAEGYCHLGMEEFSLPDGDLVRAQRAGTLQFASGGYTAFAGSDRLGLGVAACSRIGEGLSENYDDIRRWAQAIDEGRLPIWRGAELGIEDIVRTELVQRLLCDGAIDTLALEDRYDIEFAAQFPGAIDRLKTLAADGLVSLHGPTIEATSRGRLVLRIIAECFDRHRQGPHSAADDAGKAVPI